MQQSNVIFAALFIAFIVYITSKGQLSTYVNILKGNVQAASTASSSGTSTSASGVAYPSNGTTPSTVEQQAQELISQVPGIQINAPAPPEVP